uniref:Uncharacterized protein n=1 Tax=Ralstonia syzygii R24 TaxID=907261 RepID=G3A2Y0_9RALS|nr:hypothetical protein RALSY_20414 [Ralstonia syzygii R24]
MACYCAESLILEFPNGLLAFAKGKAIFWGDPAHLARLRQARWARLDTRSVPVQWES